MADKESVLEELRLRHRAPLVTLELPDDDDVTDIEETIYVQIRGAFRDYLLEASDLLVGSLEPVTVTDPCSHTYLPEVASEAWAQGLPRELLPICATHEGYYCLDIEDQVVFWRDGQQGDALWEDIWAWAEAVWVRS